MKDGNKNMVFMVDFADRDSRSFKAYLRGTGDGRHQLYDKLFAAAKPAKDLEALSNKFAQVAWETAVARMKDVSAKSPMSKATVGSSVLSRIFVPGVGLLLGVMLYQVFVA